MSVNSKNKTADQGKPAPIKKAEVATTVSTTTMEIQKQFSVEDILSHSEEIGKLKRKLQFFKEKSVELRKILDQYDELLEETQGTGNEIILGDEQESLFDYALVLKRKGYPEREFSTIHNPHIVAKFTSDMIAFVKSKEKELTESIFHQEKKYLSRLTE